MVDTINPQSGKPDSYEPNEQVAQPQQVGGGYYSGFSKPEEVHVNLTESQGNQTQNNIPANNTIDSVAPTAPIAQDVHQTYSTGSVNAKPILLVSFIGLAVAVLISVGTYFVASTIYKGRLTTEEDNVSALNRNLTDLQAVPSPLKPEEVETPESNAPIIEETPVQTPSTPVTPTTPTTPTQNEENITVPAPSSPSTTNSGNA